MSTSPLHTLLLQEEEGNVEAMTEYAAEDPSNLLVGQADGTFVESADAFVFVTPEYNFGPPPSLVNAMNYLVLEWHNKVAGFVSYGGVSGGIRATQAEKLMMTSFKIMPLTEQVMIPMFSQHLDEEKRFTPNEIHLASAKAMLDELARWGLALKGMRDASA